MFLCKITNWDQIQDDTLDTMILLFRLRCRVVPKKNEITVVSVPQR